MNGLFLEAAELLLAVRSVVFDNEIFYSTSVGTVGREVAGHIALPAIGAISSVGKLRVREVGFQPRVDSNTGVARLLQGAVELHGERLTNVIVIRETKKRVSSA